MNDTLLNFLAHERHNELLRESARRRLARHASPGRRSSWTRAVRLRRTS